MPGNIMVICRGCNRRKQNQTGEEMLEFAKAIIRAKAAYDQQYGPVRMYLDEMARES